jgi:ribosomal protein L37AE/L43A
MSIIEKIDNILKQEQTLTTGIQSYVGISAQYAKRQRSVYTCPYCGYKSAIKIGDGIAYCEKCHRKFSIGDNK